MSFFPPSVDGSTSAHFSAQLESRVDNFLEQKIKEDLHAETYSKIITRFPPEPNGFLHIGHVKSICLNFGLAKRFGGECNLRFDDTNPEVEEQKYVDAIKNDISWLGFRWIGEVRYTSDYFAQLYEWALFLINEEKAYVCHLSSDEAREHRGTLKKPGINSPYRERSVVENLKEFEKMRSGYYSDGDCVLRAKIDMASPNLNLRDPILYRVRRQAHHQTGTVWYMYPTYDFGHGQADSIEGVTHSICTLEFADHRPLYDWFLEHLPVDHRPYQYEFGRLNLSYTVTSKRKLKQLVDQEHVEGWDDPRMPTIAGMRRRGIPAAALRKFCDRIGVTRSDGVVDIAMLEHAIRDELDKNAPRAMCVFKPLKVLLTNYPKDKQEILKAPGSPTRADLAERDLPFSREIFIDADDFRETANKKYKRLVLGKRVRLRHAYVIEAENCLKNEAGDIYEIHAKIIEGSLGQDPQDGIKPKGVIHWVDGKENLSIQVRLFDRLFISESPANGEEDFLKDLNPNSLQVLDNCLGEMSLQNAEVTKAFQFERKGYFCMDGKWESNGEEALSGDSEGNSESKTIKFDGVKVFNQTISLRDTFAE